MAWQHTVYAYPIVFATFVSLGLAGYALAYAREHGRRPILTVFVAINGCIAVWTGCFAIKLLSTDPAVKSAMYRLLHVGSLPLAPLLVLFALAYTDRTAWLTREVAVGLHVVPAAFVLLVFVNPYDLAIAEVTVTEVDGLVLWRAERGPANVVLSFAYTFSLGFLALGILGYEGLRLGRSYLPQACLFALAIAGPTVASFLRVGGVPPFDHPGVNLVPATAAVSAVALGVAVFRYRLLHLPPIAYTTAMRHSPDAVVVLDADERVVHGNDAADRLLGLSEAAVGRPVGAVLPELDVSAAADEPVTVEVVPESEGSLVTGTADADAGPDPADDRRSLDVHARPLSRHGRLVGWIVVARDVTFRERYERSLEVRNEQSALVNRLVRHDIRNEMDLALGLVRRMRRQLDEGDEAGLRASIEGIETSGERVVALTETARDVMRAIARMDREPRPVPLAETLEAELDGVASAAERATVRVEGDLPAVDVLADEMLSSLFYNLLTNAVAHNDRPEPTVTVSVRVEGAEAVVAVADDGPGLPESYREAVAGDGSFADPDGSGYGLYLVRTLVDQYGGAIAVEDNEPRGTVIRVRLPVATGGAAAETAQRHRDRTVDG